MAEKEFQEARKRTEELLKQDPDNISFNGLLAEIYRSEGENRKAFEVYDELLKKNPGEPGLQLALCDLLLSEKDYEGLMNVVRTVISNSQVKKEEKVSLIAELTENQDIKHEFGEIMESVIMNLEKEYPDDELIVLLRPDFMHKENKLEEAASILEGIIKENPDNYFAWEKLLLVLYDQKNFIRLEERGRECATKFNRSVLAKILYASAAMENANYDVALDELRKSDILGGDNKEIKMQVLTMRADIYYRMKNFGESFKAFDEALKLNSADLTVLNNYSYYLAEQDMKLKEAEEMAKEVVDKEKNNNTFLDTYAWVLYKRGKSREAAKIMERIINSGEKDDAEWYEHYGYILKKMGKCNEAVEKWDKAISIDKSKTYLQKEIERCGK